MEIIILTSVHCGVVIVLVFIYLLHIEIAYAMSKPLFQYVFSFWSTQSPYYLSRKNMQCMVQGLAHLLCQQTPATNAGMGFLSWLGLLLLCSPPRSLGFTILGEIFAYVTVFLILPIEIVTFRLSGWCMLVVFFSGIRPSRTWASGSFESMRWNACAHRLDLGLYSHLKEFGGNGVRSHADSKGKIPSVGKFLPRGRLNPWHYIKQDREPNTLPTSSSSSCWVFNFKALVCGFV